MFWKGTVKTLKAPAVFERMTYRFVVNAPNHCAALLGNNFGKEKVNKIMLDFIVYFVTILKCLIPP